MTDKPDEAMNAGANGAEPTPTAENVDGASSQGVAELKAENAELKDKVLRLMAEMENYRRRSDKEKGDVMKYAITAFAGDIVIVGDNLRRAIEAVQKESENNPALKTLLEGVEVTERELVKVFERHGVTRFEPMGEKFDPHMHEAMLKVDVPNTPADVIVQVLQAGYKISERILRPAAVIVAKGSTATQPAPANSTPEEPAPAPQASAKNQGDAAAASAQAGTGMASTKEGDPDIRRKPTGEPRDASSPRKPAGEKRASTVTTPVTDGSANANRDELISSFGKRLESSG